MGQNRRPNPSTCKYRHLVFDMDGKKHAVEKRQRPQPILLETMSATQRRMESAPHLSPCTKSTLNGLRPQLRNRKHRQHLQDMCVGKAFMNRALFALELKPTVDRWHLRKLESVCTSKETVN